MTRIGNLIKEIQYAADLTIEEIAGKIGYTRPHLTNLMKRGDSSKVYNALIKKFGQQLKANSYDASLQAIVNLTESNKLLAEALNKLSKRLDKK